MVNAVLYVETGKLLEYMHLRQDPKYNEDWDKPAANKFGRFVHGISGRMKGTNTIFFVNKKEVPHKCFKDCKYEKFVCDMCPTKAELNRTRHTVGTINYSDDCSTPKTDILLVKLLFNSVISTKGAKFMMGDKNIYLNIPLLRYEYV